MALSPKLAVNRKAALMLLLISLMAPMAPCLLKIQPSKADSEVITVPDDYPTLTAAIGNAAAGDTPCVINENNRDNYLLTTRVDVSSVTVDLLELASPSPSPSPTPTSTPIDTKPLPTTLLVAVAIVACVFGFGLIINIVAGERKSSSRQGI
jgi:hypothetical protein